MAYPPPPPGPPPHPGPRPQPPPPPGGHYPQDPYYAPGWTAAAGSQRHRGRTVALVTLVLVVGLAAVGGIAAAGTYWYRTRPIGDVSDPMDASARQVRLGHCIRDLPDDGVVGSVKLVPCGDPHEAEVIDALELSDQVWPGEMGMGLRTETWCEVDAETADVDLRAVVWTPSQRSWGQGDRTALCIAWSKDGRVTGSWAEGNVGTV